MEALGTPADTIGAALVHDLKAAQHELAIRHAPYKYICEHCHSDEIVFDGNLMWDTELQDYVASDPFDDAWCSQCNDDCNTVAVPLDWKEGDPVVDVFAVENTAGT